MNWTLSQFSIVVIASNNNPTILNPDFLRIQGIVPDDWEISSPPITTPPLSTAQYSNGIVITVDQQKLQVVDNNSKAPEESSIVEIIKKYINVVPHVQYRAVGINFRVFCEIDDPANILKESFFKADVDGEDEQIIQNVGVKLSYMLGSTNFTIRFDNGANNQQTDEGVKVCPGIIAGANFHEDINPQNAQENIAEITAKIDDFWITFNNTLEKLI